MLLGNRAATRLRVEAFEELLRWIQLKVLCKPTSFGSERQKDLNLDKLLDWSRADAAWANAEASKQQDAGSAGKYRSSLIGMEVVDNPLHSETDDVTPGLCCIAFRRVGGV
mmetsp:Transcript_122020/g.304507  ORF Transcript_122020/g.304507 Transcript_122020/m.304507 type:complete len:111 (-) Transcript_122020:489-821(-)